MKVYLVNSSVDLGYNVEFIYLWLEQAEAACKKLNEEYEKEWIKGLMHGCKYSLEQAENFVRNSSKEYFVEEMEVQE